MATCVPKMHCTGTPNLDTLSMIDHGALFVSEMPKLEDDTDTLFQAPETRKLPQSSSVGNEVVLAARCDFDRMTKEIEKEIAHPAAKKLKMEPCPHQVAVETWAAQWMKRGRAGNVGQVPDCVQAHFPHDWQSAQLTSRECGLLEHYSKWCEKK